MLNCIQCEFIKLKSKKYWLYIIYFMVANVLIANFLAEKILQRNGFSEEFELIRELSYTININNYFIYGLPMMIIIFLGMYFNLESENAGWKLIKIAGEDIGKVLISKVIVTFSFILYIFLCQILVILGYSIINDKFLIDSSMIICMGISLLGTLLNSLIMFLIFYMLNSIVINIVLGILGLVVNSILIQVDFGKYFFTTYYYKIFSANKIEMLQIFFCCIVGIIIFIVMILLSKMKYERKEGYE